MKLDDIIDEGQLSEKQYNYLKKFVKEDLESYNWNSIRRNIETQEIEYDTDMEEHVKLYWLGSLIALTPDISTGVLKSTPYYIIQQYWIEYLENCICEQYEIFSYLQDGEVILGVYASPTIENKQPTQGKLKLIAEEGKLRTKEYLEGLKKIKEAKN